MRCLIILFLSGTVCYGQADSTRLQWFTDAKLGIFIHWGMYAVAGTTESWAFHNKTVPYDTYMHQLNGFTAQQYNPQAWAQLIKASGAKYAVITTQHHDGLALWDTQQLTPYPTKTEWQKTFPNRPYPSGKQALWNAKKSLSTVHQTPAARDVLTPFAQALRKEGLKFGAYYSLLDWSHANYPAFLIDASRYAMKDDPLRWKKFLHFMHNQLAEINTQFMPDLYWFDGDWEHSEEAWGADEIDSIIHTTNPNAILNGRIHTYSDYATPEQNMPVTQPAKTRWELCLTSNDNWGYRPTDTNMKSTNEVLQIFTECLGMGGNLLLDIGPKADGTIPQEQVNLLQEIGRWTTKHSEAIYGTTAGLPYGHYHGNSTLSKDKRTVYLFVNQVRNPDGNNTSLIVNLMLKGLKNSIVSAEVLGNGTILVPKIVGKISWSHVPGTVFINLPVGALDAEITVVKLVLDAPLSLYRGQGGFN